MKTIFIPLDDRPCNYRFPQQLAEITVPPRKLLGNFLKPGQPEKIIAWLKGNLEKADLLIASADLLAYGGLVASRTSQTSLKTALQRISLLKQFKNKIYLFSTILRNSITVTTPAEKKLWGLMLQTAGRPGLRGKFLDALKQHLAVRKRNLAVNERLIELAKTGVIEYLLIGKEDVSRSGFHKKEVQILELLVKNYQLQDKVKIISGADELGMLLVAKAAGFFPRVKVIYSDPDSKDLISLYEDIPISRVAKEHVESLGGKLVKSQEDLVLYVNLPTDRQLDLFLEKFPPGPDQPQAEKIKVIEKLLKQHKKIAIADVAHCNGADPQFAEAILQNIDIGKLAAFAAWNTTSNSIGSALAFGISNSQCSILTSQFPLERLIDDYLYQSIVRPRLLRYLKKQKLNPYNLGKNWKTVEKIVNQMTRHAYRKSPLAVTGYKLKVGLPWPRVFEVEINLSPDVSEEQKQVKL